MFQAEGPKTERKREATVETLERWILRLKLKASDAERRLLDGEHTTGGQRRRDDKGRTHSVYGRTHGCTCSWQCLFYTGFFVKQTVQGVERRGNVIKFSSF